MRRANGSSAAVDASTDDTAQSPRAEQSAARVVRCDAQCHPQRVGEANDVVSASGRETCTEISTLLEAPRATGTTEWVLLSIRHDGRGAVHPLPKTGSVTIGRSSRCDVRLEARGVSRVHARLQLTPELEVEDLGSVNGTHIGGCPLAAQSPRVIRPGEVFALGSLLLVVQQRPNRGAEPTAELCTSPAMARTLEDAARVARGTISVLVVGETGVGKDVLAQRIHRLSPRASLPFLRLNCAALNEALVDSELFGHERGAFTGATCAKRGLLEVAQGGTLLLDEVGELSPASQAKLLHALELGEFFPVGGTSMRKVNVRFLAATNRDLEQQVARGAFRQDLFFRLAAAVLKVPPLRERRVEILPFASKFLADAAESLSLPVPELLPDAAQQLDAHGWPGNLRELRNTMERALLASGGENIAAAHLHLPSPAGPLTGERLGSDERALIVATLARFAGNQTRAARFLGISRNTLATRIERYGIIRPRKPADTRS
jgi:two-component system, NtrC family, response regulator AtoC